jgi:hypothetical protein
MYDLSEGKTIGFEVVFLDQRFENFIYTKERTELVMLELKGTDKRSQCLTRACELQSTALPIRSVEPPEFERTEILRAYEMTHTFE